MGAETATQKVEYGAAPLGLGLTGQLCRFLAGLRFEQLPPQAVHEARRGVLDWLGCALAGSGHATIDRLLAVLAALSGRGQATVIGRDLRLGLTEAAIANGQMGHVLDYDDTHMGGVVLHTSSPVLAALLALSESRPVDGRTLIAAYVAGFEAGVRIGRSAPAHHDGGWHLTGTLGTLAAGLAAARLIGLDGRGCTHAAGIAASQAAGMQQNRGTMCKSLHAGKAAASGVLAALLAEQGFDSSDEIIEGRRGFSRIYSTRTDEQALLDGLGSEWLIASNGYKPYACGVVQHPLIDAMIEAATRHGLPASDLAEVRARVHPGVIRITGVDAPGSGLKAKFSLTHSAAVAYLDGAAGIGQYTDERAAAADVVDLRGRITAEADAGLRTDEAQVTLVTRDGAEHSVHVPHASGTVANPMSDAALEAKFMDNATPVLGAPAARALAARLWRLDEEVDVAVLVRSCAAPAD